MKTSPSVYKTHAHINLILFSQLIQTLDCTSIFIYTISAIGSIWIPNSNTGFGHKINMDTAISKKIIMQYLHIQIE